MCIKVTGKYSRIFPHTSNAYKLIALTHLTGSIVINKLDNFAYYA